jgi:hypothetical protein
LEGREKEIIMATVKFEFKFVGSLEVEDGLTDLEKEQFVENLLEKLFLKIDVETDTFESNVLESTDAEDEELTCIHCSGTGIGNPHTGSRCGDCNGRGY